ncbi:MAG: 4-hydroxy-tetrahydrodipicolinate reductase [Planctomycetota bacterium]
MKLAIHGAAGRMGRRVTALAASDPRFEIVAAVDSPSSRDLGKDAGTLAGVDALGVQISGAGFADAEVVVDFSLPEPASAAVAACVADKTPLVLATTGFDAEQRAAIEAAGATVPLVWAPSMSPAVNMVMKLAETAGKALRGVPGGADVEIIERHHRFKEDAPSGTALRFGEIVANAMGLENQTHGRHGKTGVRSDNEVGYHAVRTGDNPGEHTIVFGMLGETIELKVAASGRDCYALGALQAAAWVVKQMPGVYGMADVLGL